MVSKDWERKLESLQYQFGKAAIGLHGMPAAIGVRMELALPSMQSPPSAQVAMQTRLFWDNFNFIIGKAS